LFTIKEENMDMLRAETAERTHAEATVTVEDHQGKRFSDEAGPELVEISIVESFAGEIDGRSTVRALQVKRADGSASLISLQRVTGKLGDRRGSFVLQGEAAIEQGRIRSKWFVVPGSGTDELSGLRGDGGFEGEFGKGSRATLDYSFE
jgi:hypothetical protein